jgi:hypothetical protein
MGDRFIFSKQNFLEAPHKMKVSHPELGEGSYFVMTYT